MRHLNKSFATSKGNVLDDFNLDVKPGEFVSLIGPSGCGKTTALRIAAGLLAQTTGTVVIDGKESHGPSRDKAIVFQHFNLFPWRTAIDNVAYGLEMQRVPKAQRLERTSPRRSCRAACAGGLASPVPSRSPPSCSSWTSRSAHWTR